MLEKVTVKFVGEIGSNEPGATKENLMRLLLEMEHEFNVKHLTGIPVIQHSRVHINVSED